MNTGSEDIPVMLDSLQELFQEHGDRVTPTLLVSRMEQKLHRRLHMHVVAYLYTSLREVDSRRNPVRHRGVCFGVDHHRIAVNCPWLAGQNTGLFAQSQYQQDYFTVGSIGRGNGSCRDEHTST